MDPAVSRIHVCLVHPYYRVGVPLSDGMYARDEPGECVAISAFVEVFFDDPFVAAQARRAWEGAVMGWSTFRDSIVVFVDRPLGCYSQWCHTGSWNVMYSGGEEWYGPMVFHFLREGFVQGYYVVWF